jgi:hypothetical protein
MIMKTTLKLWFKEKWIYLLYLVPFVVWGLYLILRKKPVDGSKLVNKSAILLQEKLGEARTQAALEIGRAQGKEAAVKEEVAKISSMPTTTQEEKQKQLQDLADLINRTRRK